MEIFKNFYNQLLVVIEDGVFGVSLIDLGIILIAIFGSLILRGLFANILVSRVKSIVLKTGNKIDDSLFDALIPPFKLLPIVLVFLTISLFFDIQSTLGFYFQKMNKTLSTIFVFWLFHQSLSPLSFFFKKLEKLLSKGLVNWVIGSIKYLIIFLGAVAVLDVWGIKIGPIIAGLGLFGVAVALGAQDLFKNLISGIMILLERRFQIGDVINLPGHTEGTVEHIGFRSTLVRKFDSTPISIPNYLFSEGAIINYSNRDNRRINWNIGLEYETSLKQLKIIISEIENYIKNSDEFTIDLEHPMYVKFDKFNDSSLDLLIYCFSSTNNWGDYLEIKQNLSFKIKEIVEINNANFAFPTRSIHIRENIIKNDSFS